MERREALELTQPQYLAKDNFHGSTHGQDHLLALKGYARLKLLSGKTFETLSLSTVRSGHTSLRPTHENFGKTTHLDVLEILYQLCFNLYANLNHSSRSAMCAERK